MNSSRPLTFAAVLLGLAATSLAGQASLPPPTRASIDSAVKAAMARTGAPSVSLAVVKDGAIAYANAYGLAKLEPSTPATPAMRYSIGSVSKQFAATCILLLVEQNKLSLDDKIAKWFPNVTRANDISVRQLLNMTSGISDYWPQDYVMTPMLKPITSQQIIDRWATASLDFEPGAKYQYSNTNYVIAGRIVELVSGMPFVSFLREHILTPLAMESAFITDDGALPPSDPNRYYRYGLGPRRIAPKEGKGWLFAAGELAMSASDLARWDIAMIDQKILKPASYHEQQRATILSDGRASEYALGVTVGTFNGHREVSHGGAVSGFTSQNSVFPDDRVAIVVLTNFDGGDPGSIEQAVARILFTGPNDLPTERATAQVKAVISELQHGRIDRALLTENASDYFSAEALADFASSLGPLGACSEINQIAKGERGGMSYRAFRARCGKTAVVVVTRAMPDEKLEQFLVYPE